LRPGCDRAARESAKYRTRGAMTFPSDGFAQFAQREISAAFAWLYFRLRAKRKISSAT
jgi:hypothetical protein